MMPKLTVWGLRAALSWLVVSFTIGALLLIDKGMAVFMLPAGWLHVHIHAVTVGWLVQAVFAIAYWMLPRFGRERPRPGLAAAGLIVLNLAVGVACALPWVNVHQIVTLLEILGVVLFAAHIWPRIKPFATHNPS